MSGMNDETRRSYLSAETFLALLLLALLGLSFLDLPQKAAAACGSSGYWAVVIALLLAAPFILLAAGYQKRFGSHDLIAAAPLAIGKPAAAVGNLVFLSVFLLWLVLAVRDAADLVLTYLLNITPLWAAILGFLVLVGYVAGNGLAAVGRLASFVTLLAVLVRLAIQAAAFQGLTWLNLAPAFSAAPFDYLRGGAALANAFLPLAGVFLFYPRLAKPEKLLPAAFWAAGGAAAVFFIEVLGTIGVFGSRFTQYFNWSNLVLVHRVHLPFLVIEQVGVLFVIVWLTMFAVGCAFYLVLIAGGLRQQFPRLSHGWIVAGLLVLVGAGALALPNAAVKQAFFSAFRRWAPAPAAGYILLVYLAALLRGLRMPGGEDGGHKR